MFNPIAVVFSFNKRIFNWNGRTIFYFAGNELPFRIMLRVFIATFNNISVISWRSNLLVEETGSTLKKTTDMPSFIDKLYHIILYRVHLAWVGFKLNVTDCIGSCKSNYHTIKTTTTPESPLIIGVFLLSFWTSTIVAISNNCLYHL